jgi:hypothetical protein
MVIEKKHRERDNEKDGQSSIDKKCFESRGDKFRL